MKPQLEQLLCAALATLLPDGVERSLVNVERTRDPAHGDFASNVAMRLAKQLGRKPRDIAQDIVTALQALPETQSVLSGIEIAGAGFINFRLAAGTEHSAIREIFARGARYGHNDTGKGQRVIVEFVSSNPTGPLHVGHGRHGAFGASVSNILGACGYDVHREYYINDAGRQMEILGVSIWLRYLEELGERFEFPANGYRGEYIRDIAKKLANGRGPSLRRTPAEIFTHLPPDAPAGGDKDVYIDAVITRARELIGEEALRQVLDLGLEEILGDIRQDLEEFGVVFDQWYSERSLGTSGAIDRALDKLAAQGNVYEKDGAKWFRATAFGDEKDRVVVRENGVKTYFASDIAYHLQKRERGFERLLDILGSDHHGYVARVRAGLAAMGEPPESLDVLLVQFVTLFRGGEKAQMSTRSGEFITLRELRNEVGNDACRFFYVIRGNDQHLDFDMELAKSRSNENPVYYIQYAHARVASVLRQLASRGMSFGQASGLANLARLEGEHEKTLVTLLARYPEILAQCGHHRAPHTLAHYLRELANGFHTYYNAEQFIVEDEALRNARLALVLSTQQVLRNGLGLLGVSAPDSM